MDYKKMPSGHATWGWLELMTTDPARARDFYTKVLGWTTTEKDMGPAGKYTIFSARGEMLGGMMKTPPEAAKAPPSWTPYVQVESLDAAHAKAKELGGKECMPPTPIPGIGRFSVITDPTGAAIGFIQYD